ncbi:RNA 2'-phosphotransferase [Paracoccus caeni]|uniref:Probable RNA 2'-phosphotransferase n=1 Tax=Paracoccus caeni TaxID=657651 RepID=A0A934VZM8_9RHOB|nr:RNA 2'-phosphotransferase [Paracoccus caeni]MBK4217202.1 RNA 2'-phosphotransferase [Paracoccus caeni]
MAKTSKDDSKLLSLVLRHSPERAHVTLGPGGWVSVTELLAGLEKAGHPLNIDQLHQIVAESDKKRFTISEDGKQIRAAQGHSVAVDLGLEPTTPPAILWHGTAVNNLDQIMAEGLHPRSRQHVHLSADLETTLKVGQRHGKPVALQIDAAAMHRAGLVFWQADNRVWLTDHVPPTFISRP